TSATQPRGQETAQSYKPEHMWGDQAAKGILERHRPKPRRNIKLGNDAKGHKAHQHAQAEQCLNRHGVVSYLLCPLSVTNGHCDASNQCPHSSESRHGGTSFTSACADAAGWGWLLLPCPPPPLRPHSWLHPPS